MEIPTLPRELLLKAIGSRDPDSNKSDYGYIALLGGSPEYAGAARLAFTATAAMRAGAGVVRLIVPSSVAAALLPNMTESTLKFLPVNEFGSIRYEKAAMDEALSGIKTIGAGMGLGLRGDNEKVVAHILECDVPVVLDADALNTVARYPDLLKIKRSAPTIFTPHPGEFSRLTGLGVPEILASPLSAAVGYAQKHALTVLLKGRESIITDGERTYINKRGTPGMATAGSGDVLTGIITALFFRNRDPVVAAAAGAYIAGVAGELAAEKYGDVGMISPDTGACIASAIKKISEE